MVDKAERVSRALTNYSLFIFLKLQTPACFMLVVGSSKFLVNLFLVESVLLFFQFPVLPSLLLPVYPKGYKILNVSCTQGGKG